jgi:hypothetical protein
MNKDSFFTKKYADIFDINDAPEQERKEVARDVADWVIPSKSNIKSNSIARGE